ncbi:MAG: CCA tRNA nucleotidyltransferase [Planctomycetes bacterium]|nr:CCA tRNA nucleotidyltransferase [Planctomycetota bacterium]
MSKPDPQKQREFAIEAVRILQQAGFEACFAGGCVRDQLLGREPKDFDIATSARPDEVRDLFGHRRTLPIGASFGVITVLGPRGAGQFDVATFRSDGKYSDGRHPDEVRFSSAEEDAQRRDFTINGMFFDPVNERIIDYVGGQVDLERCVVRAIGAAEVRFAEDKLRMLRAVRFAATLAFELEAETAAAISRMADQLTAVSSERIAAEMQRMLVDPHRLRALTMLRYTRLAEVLFAGINVHDESSWDRALRTADHLDAPGYALALAAVLGELTDSRTAGELGQKWRLSNEVLRRLTWLVSNRAELTGAAQLPWYRIQPLLIHPGAADLVALCAARAEIGQFDPADVDFCRQRLLWPAERLDPPALLSGDDLVARGVPQGSVYRELLSAVRDAQLQGEIQTQADALALVDRLLKSR